MLHESIERMCSHMKSGQANDRFEQEFEALVAEQKRHASGQRLEMLCKDLSSTKEMLRVAVWPVLKSLEGLILEYELVSRSGVKVFVDAVVPEARLALESEGYVVHAQNITRERFSFERRKVRTIAANSLIYVPFSRDELEQRPEECSSSFAELIGRFKGLSVGQIFSELTVNEREVIRYGKHLLRPLKPGDVMHCLGCGVDMAYRVLKDMEKKSLVVPAGNGEKRIRQYRLTEKAYRYPL